MNEIGIYIHIPFCSSKCYYCDFVSFVNQDEQVERYFSYLLRELNYYKEMLKEYEITTIFFGGGTPSCVENNQMERLLKSIYKEFDMGTVEEITIETNPGTLNKDKLKMYKQYGINRISIGVQSLDDNILKIIGRNHSPMDFCHNYELIRNLCFDNVNIDLMYGIPEQTLEDCLNTLKKTIELNPEHISYYSLILEENTKMDKWHKEGKIILPEEDVERKMYHYGVNLLKENGYKHYEISNFSKVGFECKHNLFYWKLKPYLGLGISAHSNIRGIRFWNHCNFEDYYKDLDIGKFPISGEEKIDKKMEMAEYLIMGLRLVEGISKNAFVKRFNIPVDYIYKDVLYKYEEQELLCIDGDTIRFTSLGLDLSNMVYVDLLP